MHAMPSCLGMLSQGNETRFLGTAVSMDEIHLQVGAIFPDLHVGTCIPTYLCRHLGFPNNPEGAHSTAVRGRRGKEELRRNTTQDTTGPDMTLPTPG